MHENLKKNGKGCLFELEQINEAFGASRNGMIVKPVILMPTT